MTDHFSPEVIDALAVVPLLVGSLVIVLGLVRALLDPHRTARSFSGALMLGLEFFLAVGLLRLSMIQDLESIGIVVAIIAVRMMIRYGVAAGVKALEE